MSQGAQRFNKETGIAIAEFEPNNETQFEQAHRRFAQRGQDPIVAVGFSQALADTPAGQLSGGEKARLLLGLATFSGPHLTVLACWLDRGARAR